MGTARLAFHWSEITYEADGPKNSACDPGAGLRKRCCAPRLNPNDQTVEAELSAENGTRLNDRVEIKDLVDPDVQILPGGKVLAEGRFEIHPRDIGEVR